MYAKLFKAGAGLWGDYAQTGQRFKMRKLSITEQQERFLIENYRHYTHAQIAEILGVTRNKVSYWAMEFGLKKKKVWNTEKIEDEFFHHDSKLSTI